MAVKKEGGEMTEKRRATTFRTSKGTVVNVAAPTVYVSPAFVSSEDVTNPTEMRELLRNLDDLWLGEIAPPEGIVQLEAPLVFPFPGTWTPRIIFNGLNGAIYVAEINEQLTVSNSILLPFEGWKPSIVYDRVNKNWLVLVNSKVKDRRYGLYRVSEDFKSVVADQDPLFVDGVEWNTGGQGCLFIYSAGYANQTLCVFLDGGRGTELARGDPSALPLPTLAQTPYPVTVQGTPYGTWGGEAGKGYAHDGVGSPVAIGDDLLLVFSVHDAWDRGTMLGWATWDQTKQHFVCGLNYDVLIGPETVGAGYEFGGIGPVSITKLLGKRYIMLYTVSASKLGSPSGKTYALRLPWGYLSPKDKRLIYSLWQDNLIGAGDTSPCIPGWGKKTIHFTSNTIGNLTPYLDAVGRNDWKAVDPFNAITSALVNISQYSGLRMRLGFSVAATVTAHVVVELG